MGSVFSFLINNDFSEEINNISGFSFTSCGFQEDYRRNMEIIIASDKIIYTYKKGIYEINEAKRTLEIKKEIWFNFISNVIKLGIKSWEKNYNDPYVEDGEGWEINIRYCNGEIIKITGCNAYPKNWK